MSLQIDEIIAEVSQELNLNKHEVKAMVNVEFKCLVEKIRSMSTKTVNMIYLGKFRPTAWFLYNQDKFQKTKEEYEAIRKAKRNSYRLEKLNNQQPGS